MGVIAFLLAVICIILMLLLFKKSEHDSTLNQQEEDLKQKINDLKIQVNGLNQQVNSANAEYQVVQAKCEQANGELQRTIDKNNRIIQQDKDITEQALIAYYSTLEDKYAEIESDFDGRVARLRVDLGEVENELNKLKATRDAAHKALLKEQEVKDNKDNYRLLPSQADLNDARRLEIVKRELNKPRILAMLIWQTYWQPIAKKQFPVILQDKTKCGIYKITNIVTDECYIGQSVDCYKRWNDHCKCGLGIDTPIGNKLYKSMQEYGLENFTFELLTECEQKELNEKEKYFIELYQSDTYGFNSTKGNSK